MAADQQQLVVPPGKSPTYDGVLLSRRKILETGGVRDIHLGEVLKHMFEHVFHTSVLQIVHSLAFSAPRMSGEALFRSKQGLFIVFARLPNRKTGGGAQDELPTTSAPDTMMVIRASGIGVLIQEVTIGGLEVGNVIVIPSDGPVVAVSPLLTGRGDVTVTMVTSIG